MRMAVRAQVSPSSFRSCLPISPLSLAVTILSSSVHQPAQFLSAYLKILYIHF